MRIHVDKFPVDVSDTNCICGLVNNRAIAVLTFFEFYFGLPALCYILCYANHTNRLTSFIQIKLTYRMNVFYCAIL